MVSIFDYTDYRLFLNKRFAEMPKKGYGQSNKLANFLEVHTTLVSQVFKGHKDFTLEQASVTAEFLGLTDLESEYFVLLVQKARAGNESLRKILSRQINEVRKKSSELVNRLQSDELLTDEKRAMFYSDWSYAAVQQLTAINGFHNLEIIASHLDLSKKQTKEILDFLLKTGLCKETREGVVIGPSNTHLEASSPWVKVHHANWRQRALTSFSHDEPAKIHYTAPMTLSREDAQKIKSMIIHFLEQIDVLVEPSTSEELRCLNIDWFKVTR